MNLATSLIIPFSGKEDESLTKFVESIKSACRVAKLGDDLRVDCLALHLNGAALNSYHAMSSTTKKNFEDVVKGLKVIYEGPNKVEKHKMKFQERTLQKGEMPNALLTDLHNIASLAYPDVPECDAAATSPVKTQRKTDQLIVEANRTSRIKESFVRAMPPQYREKLMHKQDNTNVQDLCDLVERSMSIKSSCYKDEGDVFYNFDIPSTSTSNVVNPSTQMETIQQMLGTITKRLINLEEKQIENKDYTRYRSQDRQRGDSRYRSQDRKRDNRYQSQERQTDNGGYVGGYQKERSDTQPVKCYNCGNNGHFTRECRSRPTANNQQTRITGNCFNCEKPGHMKRHCRAPKKQEQNQNIGDSANRTARHEWLQNKKHNKKKQTNI